MTTRPAAPRVRRGALRTRRVGGALLVWSSGAEDPEALRAIERLAAWPGHTTVCLDVPPDTALKDFGHLADELAQVPGMPVLVPIRSAPGSTLEVGAWLAQRCGRAVLAYEGRAQTAPGGCLFVPADTGAGWVRLRPGREPERNSRRFPRPWWECPAVSEPADLGGGHVAEPIPAGVWIRPAGDPAAVAPHRSLLIHGLPPDPRFPAIVAGFPGSAGPVAVERIAGFWRSVPQDLLPAMRLSRYGPTDVPPERFGQALADAADTPVTVGSGVRVALPVRRGGHGMWTLLPEGPMAWNPYARDFGYVPSRWTHGVPPDPMPIGHRAPIKDLTEQRPGVYSYGVDAVLEVTQSGLWLRPEGGRCGDEAIRSALPDLGHAKVFVDLAEPDAETGRRMRAMAGELVKALEPRTRAMARLVFVGANGWFEESAPLLEAESGPEAREPVPAPEPVPVPEAVPGAEAEPVPASLPSLRLVSSPDAGFELPGSPGSEPVAAPASVSEPSPRAPDPDPDPDPGPEPDHPRVPAPTGPRVQPVPSAQAAAIPPASGIGEERAWLRRNLSRQYDATASSVARVLSRNPGLRAGAGTADALTDLVAVSLYLDGKTRELDDAVRSGTVGPHVPLARCVASGLRRLPSFRGVARLRAQLDESQLRWYGGRELVTEWSFCPVLTSGRVELPGDVDVLIWSMTARRTALIDPSLPEQAVFLPGTSFKRLRAGDASREIYLRELVHTEVAADGTVESRAPLDELALTALESAAEAWRRDGPTADLDAGLEDRFSGPPGLIGRSLSARAGRAATSGGPVTARRPGGIEQGEAA